MSVSKADILARFDFAPALRRRLPANVKARWTEALRSGQYEQGKGYLRTQEDKFCCLGVLCDIIDSTGWQTSSVTAGGAIPFVGDESIIGSTVRNRIDADIYNVLRSYSVWEPQEEVQMTLAHLNDGRTFEKQHEPFTFNEIADFIDRYL